MQKLGAVYIHPGERTFMSSIAYVIYIIVVTLGKKKMNSELVLLTFEFNKTTIRLSLIKILVL